MSGINPEHRETESLSNHPLEGYVTKCIARLERLMSGDSRASSLAEDGRDLLSWWREAKILLNLHVVENQLVYRVRSALVQRNLSPLFEAHLTDSQYQRLTDAFAGQYKQITALADRFISGPGKQTAHSVVSTELETAKEEMRKLFSRVYVVGRQNR